MTEPQKAVTDSRTVASGAGQFTTFEKLPLEAIFEKLEKLGPKEHPYLIKTGKKSASYCDETGRIISNGFLMGRKDQVIHRLQPAGYRLPNFSISPEAKAFWKKA